MAANDQYFLGHSETEQHRLLQQARELAAESGALFDRIGIRPGSRAVEIGCGPLGCLELLAERVGPHGAVVGVETSEYSVGLARRAIGERSLTTIEVRQGDGKATGLPRDSFDLATARLVLVNVPEPEQIVEEMVALVRRGGVVALHEADFFTHLCEPPLEAWDRLMAALVAYSRGNGIDLFIGRRIASMLRRAGLVDVEMQPLVHVYPPGHSRRPIFVQFVRNLRDRIVAHGLMSGPEFSAASAAVEAHLEDPETVVVSHLFFQAWGKKPSR